MPLDAANGAPYTVMGPGLLAEQPPVAPKDLLREASYWPILYQHLESRRNALRNWRWSWLLHWQALAAMFLPRRWRWLFVVANRMWNGAPINDQIIDSTPLQAVRVCAGGLWTGLMSPSRKWFSLNSALPWLQLDQDAKEWLEDTANRIDVVFHQSNFYNMGAQMFQDVTVFGTSPMIIYEDAESVIRCYLPCPGEYYLANGSRFTNDTLYREFTLTIAQVVEMFRVENCPPDIQEMWNNGGGSLDSEVVVCHAIEPNFDLASRSGKKAVRVLPHRYVFRETYWIRGQKSDRPLSLRGFFEKPFMSSRWAIVANEPYGRSPCMDALGDAKQIQLEALRKAEFIEKGVRPPMGADPELKNEPASIIPATITYMNTAGGKKGFWPLFEPNAQWLQGLVQDIAAVTSRIQSCLYVDLFMAITRMEGVQPRNELELTKRDLERLQQLGPVIELFETEFAGPAIQRTMEIMRRRGMLKPVPPSLRGVPLKVEYQSIMRMASQSAEAISLKDFLTSMGAASAAAKAAQLPDPLRIVNLDEWGRNYADATHVKTKIIFTEDEVKQHDQVRAQEMEKAKQETQAPQAGLAAVKAASTLANTPLNNGSALDAIVGPGAFPGR